MPRALARRRVRGYGVSSTGPDTRLRVRHRQQKWFGRLEKKLGGDYWSVQQDGYEYYKVCKEDDLEPVNK